MRGFQLRRGLHQARDAQQRVLGRQVAIRWREERRPLNVRHVVRAAGGDADHLNPQLRQQRQQTMGLVHARAMLAEGPRPVVIGGPVVGDADAVRAGLPGGHVEGAQAQADAESRRLAADAGDDLAQEARAVFEAAAVASRATEGAEKLVAQVAVAVLDIDPGEAGALRQTGRVDEVLDQAGDLVVAEQDRVVVGRDAELRVQQGMTVERARLHRPAGVGAAEAAGVRQLQADAEVVDRAEALAVGLDEGLAQAGDGGQGRLVEQQLVGVGAALVAHGDGLPAPDELGAAEAEASPAADRQLRGLAVERPVPALHGQDAPAVADGPEVAVQRPGHG